MNAFAIAGLQYLPFVLAGVKAVEDAIPDAPGASKKAVFMAGVTAAAKVGEQVPESHVQLISTLADTLVAALNAAGIFKHKAPAKP